LFMGNSPSPRATSLPRSLLPLTTRSLCKIEHGGNLIGERAPTGALPRRTTSPSTPSSRRPDLARVILRAQRGASRLGLYAWRSLRGRSRRRAETSHSLLNRRPMPYLPSGSSHLSLPQFGPPSPRLWEVALLGPGLSWGQHQRQSGGCSPSDGANILGTCRLVPTGTSRPASPPAPTRCRRGPSGFTRSSTTDTIAGAPRGRAPIHPTRLRPERALPCQRGHRGPAARQVIHHRWRLCTLPQGGTRRAPESPAGACARIDGAS
jgi:hypothetical protein